MKSYLSLSLTLALGMVGLLLIAGCSKQTGQQWNRNVDVNAMIEQLQAPGEQERANAAVALSEAGPYAEKAVPALIQALKDQSPLVRRLAAFALGTVGPKASSAVPALKELLAASADRDLLNAAINAIRAIDPNAMPDAHIPNVTTPVD